MSPKLTLGGIGLSLSDAYGRWMLTGGGCLREVVAYGRWMLTGGGCILYMYERRQLQEVTVFILIQGDVNVKKIFHIDFPSPRFCHLSM